MKSLTICAVGRQKDSHLRALCQEYYKRCRRWLKIEERESRDLVSLERTLPDRGTVVALDERGRQFTSQQFAEWLERWLTGASPCGAFIIGGADGLTEPLRGRADLLLSLGPMTYAHRIVRLVLAEQLYRAISIIEGAPYHRQ